jgi:hypothetical protein
VKFGRCGRAIGRAQRTPKFREKMGFWGSSGGSRRRFPLGPEGPRLPWNSREMTSWIT